MEHEKHITPSSVPDAVRNFNPMATSGGNTALTTAISAAGSKAVSTMSNEQFEAEKDYQAFWSLTNLTRMSFLTKWMSSMYRKPIRWRFISKTAELSQKIVRTLDTRSAGRLNIVKGHQNSGENTAQIQKVHRA
ncbi:MAG: hypothetical protein LUF00_11375 [Lachnospiraceae bacterium]|nr:hypothetical protein [Lachnospiraceae bacterium]